MIKNEFQQDGIKMNGIRDEQGSLLLEIEDTTNRWYDYAEKLHTVVELMSVLENNNCVNEHQKGNKILKSEFNKVFEKLKTNNVDILPAEFPKCSKEKHIKEVQL